MQRRLGDRSLWTPAAYGRYLELTLSIQRFKNINRICKSGLTVLIIEQNVRMALLLADYAYIIRDGNIHLQGKASELVNDDRVRLSYLGGTVAKV